MIHNLPAPAAMRVIRLLVGSPPKTVAQLIRETGVTRTAVTEQLNELVEAGYLTRKTERLPGRGRPRHLYSANDSALTLIAADAQKLVMPAMWEAIEEVGGEPVFDRVVSRVANRLAEHYRKSVTGENPRERLRQFVRMLQKEGAVVELADHNGSARITKRSCPFSELIEERHAICQVDDLLMRQVVGGRMRRVACRHSGDPCCAYELTE